MNFLKLKYFIDIADTGSISAAARKNMIAQQSMSANLKSLEQHYGIELFYRVTPLQLTPEGGRLYNAATQILSIMRDFEQSLSADEPPLRIGMAFDGMPPFMTNIIDYINNRRNKPLDIQIKLNCSDLKFQPDDIDLFIGVSPPEGFTRVRLLDDQHAVVATGNFFHKAYGTHTDIIIDEVKRTGSTAPLRELEFAAFAQNDQLPSIFDGLNITFRCNNGAILDNMCRNGKCALLVAKDYAEKNFSDSEDMLIIPLKASDQQLTLYIYYRKGKSLSKSAQTFIRSAKNYFATAKNNGQTNPAPGT